MPLPASPAPLSRLQPTLRLISFALSAPDVYGSSASGASEYAQRLRSCTLAAEDQGELHSSIGTCRDIGIHSVVRSTQIAISAWLLLNQGEAETYRR